MCWGTNLSVCGKDVDVVDRRGGGEEGVARPFVVQVAAADAVAVIVGRGLGRKQDLPAELLEPAHDDDAPLSFII